MTHPMTAVIIQDIEDGIRDCILSGEDVETNHLRAGADWQLEQVIDWLDKNLTTYINAAYWGEWKHISDLKDPLKKAMRPTQEDN